MIEPDIKECPFCQSNDAQILDRDKYGVNYITCLDCGCRGPISEERRKSVEAWNKGVKREDGE